MLEHVPVWLGKLLHNVRAGHAKLASAKLDLPDGIASVQLMSPAFAGGTRLPERFTADGEGVSPPLAWGRVPPLTQALVLIVEDPDAPVSEPILHALVAGLEPAEGELAEGAWGKKGGHVEQPWRVPDPPTGHGVHDYVFQLFALDVPLTAEEMSSRAHIVEAMKGHVIGRGMLVGQYWRGEAAQFEAVVPTSGSAPTPPAA